MYLQITTRCNMSCEHCGFACTSEGMDMSLKTFRKALEYDDGMITLGGGEPTIHPKFWQILGESISSSEYVWLATNGKLTTIALALAKLAKKGIIGCDLSQDDYHDPIDERVIQAFTKEKKTDGIGGYYNQNNDNRGIRDVSGREITAGRCDFGNPGCVCENLICTPSGDVFVCGCEDSPKLGNVHTEIIYPDNLEYGMCWKNQDLN